MKILVLDGFKDDDSYADKTYESLEGMLNEGNEVERIRLCRKNISPCTGCFGCWMKKPGTCMFEDDSQEIVKRIINSDVVVYFTPVVFGGYSSSLKKLLDKSICLVSPLFMKINGEMHHRKRYDKYPTIVGAGIMERHDEEQAENFKNLVCRNSLNMHSPYQRAEVMSKDDDEDTIRRKLSALMNGVEVKK